MDLPFARRHGTRILHFIQGLDQHFLQKKKRPTEVGRIKDFPAATYSPTGWTRSTIGPGELSFRVRNGIGRFLPGMATRKKLQPNSSRSVILNKKLIDKENQIMWSSLTTD